MTVATITPAIGHNSGPLPPVGDPIWPEGTQARIFRRERSVTTSGTARTRQWVLRFERRTPSFIEPLMGWTGGDDTLAAQVELTFGSRDEAVAYAERQGLAYRVEGEPMSPAQIQRQAGASSPEERRERAGQLYARAAALAWMDPR